MKRYYPLLRREAMRLIVPTALALWVLVFQMLELKGDFMTALWSFERYGVSAYHPSFYLSMDWIAFAFLIGMAVSLAQHFTERSAHASLWWEKLPYSRWERLAVKSVCGAISLVIPAAMGFLWTKGIVFANADWIALTNAGFPDAAAVGSLLQAEKLAAYWLFLLSGALVGYAFFGFLCQIFGHWWRAALIGAAVWIFLLYWAGSASQIGRIRWREYAAATGDIRSFEARDMAALLPWIKGVLLAAGILLAGSFLLEKRRPWERNGCAMLYPKIRWYVVGAILLVGILVECVHTRFYIPSLGAIAAALILTVTPFDILRRKKIGR